MKKYLSWVPILLIVSIIILIPFSKISTDVEQRSYSHFIQSIDDDKVKSVKIGDEYIRYKTEKKVFITNPPARYDGHIERLNDKKIPYEISNDMSLGQLVWSLIIPIFIFCTLFLVFLVYRLYKAHNTYERMQEGGSGIGDPGAPQLGGGTKDIRSNISIATPDDRKIKFDDVAGSEEVKKELQVSVDFLKNPKKYHDMGAEMPKGLILHGPPGTGKTLLAKAVAGESEVPFLYCSASEFVEVYVGVGASRVREIFEKARAHAPSVLFIDEIDAIGKNRSSGRDSERDQTLNQILVEMDGFSKRGKDVMVIAATNRFDTLDPALVRPGRFDKHLDVPLPTREEREKIFNLHIKNLPRVAKVDVQRLSKKCIGFSGADIRNVVNEASIMAVVNGCNEVNNEHMDRAVDRVSYGTENKSKMTRDENELRNTAYHESGHAVIAMELFDHCEVDKVTIIPRSNALGFVSFIGDDDKSKTKNDYLNEICVLYGGRVAEEMLSGDDDFTAGAYSDIKMGTNIIRAMIEHYGMGPNLLSYDPEKHLMSDSDIETISNWTRGVSEEQHNRAKEILKNNWNKVVHLANILLEKETIYGDELESILKGVE